MNHLAVLASGNGSNLQAIIDAAESGVLPDTRVSVVATDRRAAYALQRAAIHGIPTIYHPFLPYRQAGRTRREYDADLAARLRAYPVDLVVLLYHGPEAGAEALLEAVPGIDVMVLAHDQRRIEPRKVGGALLVSPGQDGNLLGALELSPDGRDGFRHRNRFIEFDYARDPDDPATRARIDRYVRALSQPARSSR